MNGLHNIHNWQVWLLTLVPGYRTAVALPRRAVRVNREKAIFRYAKLKKSATYKRYCMVLYINPRH